jgi:hypothetical protein
LAHVTVVRRSCDVRGSEADGEAMMRWGIDVTSFERGAPRCLGEMPVRRAWI